MVRVLLAATNSVLPIVLLILFGVFLQKKAIIDEEFARRGNKLVFKFFLPCSLFVNVYSIDSFSGINWSFILYTIIIVTVLFVFGLITAVLLTNDSRKRGVIVQCVFRSNMAIIGLSLASALGGELAVAVASVVSAVTIPLFNILAVISLSIFTGDSQSRSEKIKTVLKGIITNPLIGGIFLGFICLLVRFFENELYGSIIFSIKDNLKFLYSTVDKIKSITTPFALIVIGSNLKMSAVKGMAKEIAVGSLWRVVLAPIIGIGGAYVLTKTGFLSCGINEYPALVALLGSPVAVSSAVIEYSGVKSITCPV